MKLIKWLDKNFELAVMAVMLAVMSILSFVNVIMRYFFKSALSWSDEVCCYCLALSAFFCPVLRHTDGNQHSGGHIRHSALQKGAEILELVCSVVMIGFLALC